MKKKILCYLSREQYCIDVSVYILKSKSKIVFVILKRTVPIIWLQRKEISCYDPENYQAIQIVLPNTILLF